MHRVEPQTPNRTFDCNPNENFVKKIRKVRETEMDTWNETIGCPFANRQTLSQASNWTRRMKMQPKNAKLKLPIMILNGNNKILKFANSVKLMGKKGKRFGPDYLLNWEKTFSRPMHRILKEENPVGFEYERVLRLWKNCQNASVNNKCNK